MVQGYESPNIAANSGIVCLKEKKAGMSSEAFAHENFVDAFIVTNSVCRLSNTRHQRNFRILRHLEKIIRYIGGNRPLLLIPNTRDSGLRSQQVHRDVLANVAKVRKSIFSLRQSVSLPSGAHSDPVEKLAI